jgi:hypothetical protein
LRNRSRVLIIFVHFIPKIVSTRDPDEIQVLHPASVFHLLIPHIATQLFPLKTLRVFRGHLRAMESTSSLDATVPRTVGSIPPSSSFTTFTAGDGGIEPPLSVLETDVLPLN